MADVSFIRREYKEALADWDAVDSVCRGDAFVKSKGVQYLPLPNPFAEQDGDAKARYEAYKERAILYNITYRTLQGMLGLCFVKKPEIKLSSTLEYLRKNADYTGQSLTQHAKLTVWNVLRFGHCGIFTDLDEDGEGKPKILMYGPRAIINWRVGKAGGQVTLTMVVLAETYEEQADFAVEEKPQWRELRLIDGVYTCRIWRKDEDGEFYIHSETVPKAAKGRGTPLDFIPFTFVGAVNNDHIIDRSPSIDLARHNIKHFQVTAEWYNAMHLAAQPIPWMAGVDENWYEFLQKCSITVGDGQIVPLPEGGQMGYAYLKNDGTIPDDLNRLKEEMVSYGAQFLQSGTVAKTATQSDTEAKAQYSVLSSIAYNTNIAYTKHLGYCAHFLGARQEDTSFEMDTEIIDTAVDPQMIAALVTLWQSGRLPPADMNNALRRLALLRSDKTDEEIEEEIGVTPGMPDLDAE